MWKKVCLFFEIMAIISAIVLSIDKLINVLSQCGEEATKP